MAEQLLQINGLKVSAEDKEILHGIDLTVNRGETHVLMGPNGAGKSTMIKIISGAIQPDANGGSMEVDGDTVRHMTPAAAREKGIKKITQTKKL